MRLVAIIIAGLLLAQTGIAQEESGRIEPGNFLYHLKIWLEKFSLNFVFNQTEKARRMLDMADKRLTEAETMENNTGALKSTGKVSIIQQSIIEAGSSSGGSTIKVSVVDGNVTVHTEGGNATITRDGGNVTVISVTNDSKQLVIIKSTRNQSSSSSVAVVQNGKK